MKITRRHHLALLGGAFAGAALPGSLMAASHSSEGGTVHEVLMLNRHPDDPSLRQVFVPAVVRAQPGDTIRFVAEDRGHNAASIADMLPEGAQEWSGGIGETIDVTVEAEGAYGYHCTPHAAIGMVGLILVGDVSGNYEELKSMRFRGAAARRWEMYFEEADAILAAEG